MLVSGRKQKLKRPRFVNFEVFNINIISENPRDRPVADMMQYVNNLEERLKDSSAANERRDEHDYPWPRNPDLKELKKKSMISRICQLHIIMATILSSTIIILNKI